MQDLAQQAPTIREVVGIFPDYRSFETAIDELLSHGFDRANISVLAGEQAVEEKLGHMFEKNDRLEDDPHAPRAAYLARETLGEIKGAIYGAFAYLGAVTTAGAILASGGAVLGATIAAALAGGSGALIASILTDQIGESAANKIQEQIEHGGLLLWVQTSGAEQVLKAVDIMERHSGQDVHLHKIPVFEAAA